ncbi:class A beta-lactamase [Phycicoccus jejuensis]|uniref:class A beta-lactamase n=1 Tax=Phycicoccus jejuensis TaxID=367299 RepID=UPI00055D7D88|nr:class A beta-lactamase [Phycicoccus jejuensis]
MTSLRRPHRLTRTRSLLLASSVVGVLSIGPAVAAAPLAPTGADVTTATSVRDEGVGSRASDRAFAALERVHDATLGVTAIDTATGRTVSWRSGTRFPFASTNKTFIAAAVLDRSSDADLDEVVRYTREDLLEYAPVTSRFVDTGMTVRELLDAALRFSDNTAANLLVERLGGPGAVQAWLREHGDRVTRVDRVEPELNEALPGDPRDTTTPAQFARGLRDVVLGSDLAVGDRTLLRNLMLGCTTGDATVRAGVDPAWPVADKTGTGEYGVRDDIAVVYPAGRAPVVVAVFTRQDTPDAEPDNALVAAATREAVDRLVGPRR